MSIESAQKFKGRVKHVLIKNQAFSDEDDWKQIFQDYPQLEQLLAEQNIPQIVLPRLGTSEKNVIDNASGRLTLPFAKKTKTCLHCRSSGW